jgi:hypothetical protein
MKTQFNFHEVPRELKSIYHLWKITIIESVVPVSATTWQPVTTAGHGDTAVQDMTC